MTMQLEELRQKHCAACEDNVPPLENAEVKKLLASLTEWKLKGQGKRIQRKWVMADFSAALEFIAHIGEVAESENHHPDIHLTDYRKVEIELSTHAIDALSENDFIVAAKIDGIPVKLKTD